MRKWSLPGVLMVAIVLICGAWARSSPPEPHFSSASLSGICRSSAFVHGYVHGYEEGFHIADLRLYAPRYAFNPPELDKKDEKAYRPEFGDKAFFRSGYRYGFGSGYADGMAGRKFRALELIRDSLTDSLDPKAFRADNLDRGLSMGYFAGRERGLRDGRLREPFRPDREVCGQQGTSEAPGFCVGIKQGYRMGYTDGYQNQYEKPGAQTASR